MDLQTNEKLRHVNAVLLKLSQDEDLQDDLKLPAVKNAIDHWTGKNRLDPEKAQQLQNNRRVVYVLQRFQMLQSVCQLASMPVPLDHLLAGKTELDMNIIQTYFGNKGAPTASKPREVDKTAPPLKSTPSVNIPIPPTAKAENIENAEVKAAISVDAPTLTIVDHAVSPDRLVQAQSLAVDVNTVIKFFIALTVIMIAVVLAQLLK